MRRFSLGQLALSIFGVGLLGAAPVANAAQPFGMCDLFSTDEAAQFVGEPIVNSVESPEVCARYGEHAATLLELKQFQVAPDANQHGGTEIPDLGDAARLTTSVDGHLALLWVVSGRYVVSVEVNLDDEPTEVTADDLAPLVQRMLDNLPQPVAISGCDPASAGAMADYLKNPDVTGVTIIGGCHYLAIATRLADSAVSSAMDICEKAAEVAYTAPMGDIRSIAITSNADRELAIGLKGFGCIGEL